MEKRLVLAIALSILVLLGWSALMPKPQHIAPQDVITKADSSSQPVTLPTPVVTQPLPVAPEKLITYSQDNLEVVFDESPAAIKEVVFLSYNNYKLPLKYGCLLKDPTLIFKKDQMTGDSISFSAVTPGKRISKKFTFHNSNYTMELAIKIQNTSSNPVTINLPLLLGALDFSSGNQQARYQDITIATQDKVAHINARKNTQLEGVKFLGLRDQYFAAIVEPDSGLHQGFVNKINNYETELGLNVQKELLLPSEQIGHLYHIYIGPQDINILNKNNPAWAGIIHYGTFDFISQILLQILGFIYNLVHNWGLAIVLLSLVVYLILYPLSLKQMRSMKEMQALQPKVEALRKTYKDNPQKMNKEIMELYKEHKVNPLGGCLPLLLQMPIFFALYNALMRSIVLKGARFLWIRDLSEPDRLWVFPEGWPNLPIIGHELNILPIIMAIGMFVQQKISAVSTGSAAAEQQKIMLIVMPVMFGLIFYRMPSGLVLYWFVNSMLMLIFQLRMNRAK
ncbi:MAG: membrane protein insertase YidC [Candidatus Omnitrophica bacterium]|nr:membrane protein insertase YidC [Candidatus Omnitrophota bacterium]